MEMACAHSPGESNSNKFLSLTHQSDVNELTFTNLKRFRSHDQLVKHSVRDRLFRRTKSLSTHLILNIDELLSSSILPQQCPNSSEEPNKESESSCSWENVPLELNLPISLKFQDVKYKVAMKGSTEISKEGKYILEGVSGSVKPGEVLALIGPSGGGKTTLLNLLSGRGEINSGSITYNNHPYTKSLKRRIGYVLQDDMVLPHLTVKETLTYAALLRLPNSLSKEQKRERAINIMCELGLERCQDTVVGGGYVRGISGGERKRVCIGNEILLNPSLLFLDEPTSGLDSSTALRIVQMLHAIAKTGKTVVTTIHQPSSRLFSKFDKLILLGKGSSLYFGKASEAMLYFNSIGCSPLIAMNPAEFLIDLANGNMNDKSMPSGLESKRFETDAKPSPLQVQEYLAGVCEERASKLRAEGLIKPTIAGSPRQMKMSSSEREMGATWCEQFSVLVRRGFKERRHEYFSLMRVLQVVATALIVGSLWWRCNSSSPRGLQDQAGLLFFISVFWGFFPLFTAVFTFPQERAMLNKERSVGLYKLSAYFAARNMTDVPLDLILPVLFMLIVYFMVGLKPTFSAFSLTMLTVFFSITAAQGLGLSIGAAFMDVKKAMTLASVILMTFMLSGGFFIQNVPHFMSWVRYLSFNYHTYKLLLKIQYSCKDCHQPIIRGLKLDSCVIEVVALAAMVIGYRFLAYLLLKRIKF